MSTCSPSLTRYAAVVQVTRLTTRLVVGVAVGSGPVKPERVAPAQLVSVRTSCNHRQVDYTHLTHVLAANATLLEIDTAASICLDVGNSMHACSRTTCPVKYEE